LKRFAPEWSTIPEFEDRCFVYAEGLGDCSCDMATYSKCKTKQSEFTEGVVFMYSTFFFTTFLSWRWPFETQDHAFDDAGVPKRITINRKSVHKTFLMRSFSPSAVHGGYLTQKLRTIRKLRMITTSKD
jgi:hypothetical protein